MSLYDLFPPTYSHNNVYCGRFAMFEINLDSSISIPTVDYNNKSILLPLFFCKTPTETEVSNYKYIVYNYSRLSNGENKNDILFFGNVFFYFFNRLSCCNDKIFIFNQTNPLRNHFEWRLTLGWFK